MGTDIMATMDAYRKPRSLNLIRASGYEAHAVMISISTSEMLTMITERKK